MKFVRWSFQNLEVPMINISGTLYCTNKKLSEALGISESGLRDIYNRHKDEFDDVSVSFCDAKELLLRYKRELGITRVREDMRLWTEDDMILFAALSKSSISKQFRKEFVKFIKQNAVRGFVSKEEFEQLEASHAMLAHKFECLEQSLQAASVPMNQIASAAGQIFRMQKETKPFRTMKEIKGA